MIQPGHVADAVCRMATCLPLAAWDDRMLGKWLFTGVFGLLILWLLLISRERLGQQDRIPKWWRNVRVWAVVIATIQLLVYALWG